MGATEGLKCAQAQRLGSLSSRVGDEKLETDLSGQVTKQAQSLGIDAKQYSPKLVGLALDRAAQEVDKPHLSQDLLG